jgi:fatty acid-binding protein DegV
VPVALDGVAVGDDLPLDVFYARSAGGAVATTSQPRPDALARVYRDAATGGAREVLSIHLDTRASGTVSAAELAASGSPIDVHVVDAGTVSYGVAVCVREAAGVLAAGGSTADAAEAARARGATLRNAFLAIADRPGRIPASDAWPLFRCEGAARPLALRLPRGRGRSSHRCSPGGPVSVAVGHAGRELESAADDLAHRLVGVANLAAVERYRVGAAVGAHTGPTCFGLFWWPTG